MKILTELKWVIVYFFILIYFTLFDNPDNWEEFRKIYSTKEWEKLTQRQQWEIESRKVVKLTSKER